MNDCTERGMVRVLCETIRLESHEVEGAVIEGLATAGSDGKPGEIVGQNQHAGGVTLKVYRRLNHV